MNKKALYAALAALVLVVLAVLVAELRTQTATAGGRAASGPPPSPPPVAAEPAPGPEAKGRVAGGPDSAEPAQELDLGGLGEAGMRPARIDLTATYRRWLDAIDATARERAEIESLHRELRAQSVSLTRAFESGALSQLDYARRQNELSRRRRAGEARILGEERARRLYALQAQAAGLGGFPRLGGQ